VSFGLMIEILVAILLMLTIGYCYTLNRRLERLRADEQSLKGTIGELVTATDVVLTRLSRVVVAARSLHDVPSAATAPDPKAVAAAARSFADRLRERVGTAAA
jgi:hypothetical protein